jgi:hypothetical protein
MNGSSRAGICSRSTSCVSKTFVSNEIALRRHLKPYFGEREVASITSDDLVRWQAQQREQGASLWSVKARWNPLRMILSHAVRHGYASTNPISGRCDALGAAFGRAVRVLVDLAWRLLASRVTGASGIPSRP